MRTIAVEKTDLNACVKRAQSERIVLTRDGQPVALIVGISDLDKEQIQLGKSDAFWKLIGQRRRSKSFARSAFEQKLNHGSKRKA